MKKRIICGLLAAATAFTLTSCGDKKQAVTESNMEKGVVSYPIETDEKLTVWMNLPGQVSSVVSNYGETPFAKNLAEATGIEVEYIHPAQGQDSALNLLIASGDMPDIVKAYWHAENPNTLIEQNVIYNLNDFIDDYSPNYKKYLEENPDIKKQVTTDDGYNYVYPFLRAEKSLCATAGFMLRSDWLKEFGLEVPKTIADWDKVLEAFKTKCEAPFATNRYDMFAGGLGAFASEYVDNGTVKYGPIQPEYKELMKKLNEWFQKGYIDKNFAISDSKLMDSNILNGISGVTFGAGGGKMGTYLSAKAGESFDLAAAPYPSVSATEKGKYSGMEWQYTTLGCAITTACKNPQLAARYLDYGYSEEGMMFYNFGKEGESYDMVDGYPKYKAELTDATDGTPVSQKLTMNCLGSESGPFVQDKRYLEQYYGTDQQRDAIVQWSDNDFYDYKFPTVMLSAEEGSEYSSIMAEIKTYVDETFSNIIIGKTPVDEFDNYVETVKSMGIDQAMSILQAAYDRYQNK